MGKEVQIISVAEPRPGFVRIEIDRSLSGSGHEGFDAAPAVDAPRPVDLLARVLFDTGLVRRVHIFSNIITVQRRSPAEVANGDPTRATMEETEQREMLREAVEQLFVHYGPGVHPTPV